MFVQSVRSPPITRFRMHPLKFSLVPKVPLDAVSVKYVNTFNTQVFYVKFELNNIHKIIR